MVTVPNMWGFVMLNNYVTIAQYNGALFTGKHRECSCPLRGNPYSFSRQLCLKRDDGPHFTKVLLYQGSGTVSKLKSHLCNHIEHQTEQAHVNMYCKVGPMFI